VDHGRTAPAETKPAEDFLRRKVFDADSITLNKFQTANHAPAAPKLEKVEKKKMIQEHAAEADHF
jgi:hypothetical protein